MTNKIEKIQKTINYINSCPDKYEWKTTTSRYFKFDLLKILNDHCDSHIIEMGAAQGHTTYLLSLLTKKVTAVEIDQKNCDIINNLSLDNVNVIKTNLYDENFTNKIDNICDIAFIDAVHEYDNVIIDSKNAILLGSKIIIYDDYGLVPSVKKAVQQFMIDNPPKHFSYVGLPPASIIESTINKVLQDWEGIVLFY